MSKHVLLFITVIIASTSALSQGWVKSFGSKQGNTEITGVATDGENRPIIAGTFSSGELDLDGSNMLINNGITDVFLLKYDTAGNLAWKLSFGGQKEEKVTGLCLDEENNIYITGNFRSSKFSIGDRTVSSAWPDNIYVAKFNPGGDLLWFKHSTGITNYAWPSAVRYGGNMGILFSGSTNASALSFGDIDLAVNSGWYKGYYGVIDTEGNFLRADLVGEEGENANQYRFYDITSDGNENIYIAGSKVIHTEPDPVTWSEYRDVMYLSKVGTDGKTAWTIEDTALYQADRIIWEKGTLFVAGSREEYRFIFNGGTIDTTSAFYYGAYDLQGSNLWGHKHVGALAYDAYAQEGIIVLIGGLLLDHMDLGDYQLDRNADSSSNCPIYQDIFYLEVSKSGELRNAKSISGSLEDIPTSVKIAENGDLYYSGIFESYRLNVEEKEIINNAKLSVFQHVSGTYYDRSIFTFIARSPKFGPPAGNVDPRSLDFRLYPNPAREQVHIEMQSDADEVDIRLMDMQGREVASAKSFSPDVVLDLSPLSPGMYIISVSSGNTNGVRRLIVSGR